ncbi:MAG: GNAT family N-acetyltransferase [Labilithrix sp.]|nr:GNAT family N-acetyltransferase [Labilithrix sp.]MBX3211209.1 GNAT family N-acetyltransferase [Labilithrix sp.]
MSSDRVTMLPWDTEHFGVSIGRIDCASLGPDELEKALDACAVPAVACLYCLVAADEPAVVRVLERRGARFVDVRMTLERSLEGALPTPPPTTRAAVVEGDLEPIRALAATSHRDSRFYADSRFSRERCDELYRIWIEKGVRDERAMVITEGPVGEPAGYVSCHVDGQVGTIGLVSVRPDRRGHGVGARLMSGALSWFASAGVTRVSVVTQVRNVAAQRLYQAAGFRTRSVALWFHLWLDERPESSVRSG